MKVDIITNEYGSVTEEAVMNKFEYRINEDVYDWIKKGTKRIEIRLYNEKAQKINIGDTITFTTLETKKTIEVKVTALLRYANILDLCKDFSMNLIANEAITEIEIKQLLEDIFGKEEVEKHDILGIKFELNGD